MTTDSINTPPEEVLAAAGVALQEKADWYKQKATFFSGPSDADVHPSVVANMSLADAYHTAEVKVKEAELTLHRDIYRACNPLAVDLSDNEVDRLITEQNEAETLFLSK